MRLIQRGSLTPQNAKSLVWLCFFVKFYDFRVAICGYVCYNKEMEVLPYETYRK